jgi:hypothetical protein
MRLFGHQVALGRETLIAMAGVAFTIASAALILAMVMRPAEPPIETSAPAASSGSSFAAAPQDRVVGRR